MRRARPGKGNGSALERDWTARRSLNFATRKNRRCWRVLIRSFVIGSPPHSPGRTKFRCRPWSFHISKRAAHRRLFVTTHAGVTCARMNRRAGSGFSKSGNTPSKTRSWPPAVGRFPVKSLSRCRRPGCACWPGPMRPCARLSGFCAAQRTGAARGSRRESDGRAARCHRLAG